MIELRNITKFYKKNKVLSQISFTVEKEILTLFGPTGSGKTTLLRLIAGLESPDEGEIFIEGEKVSSPGFNHPPYRRKVNMVFQDLALWPHMNIYEHLEFTLSGTKSISDKEKKIKEVLNLLGLEKFQNRFPHQLSGGQQQKLAVARAIINEPRILLFDEPFVNLDIVAKDQMKALLKNIFNLRNVTVIYVTHDFWDALEIGGRLVFLNKGRVQKILRTEELLAKGERDFLEKLFQKLKTQIKGTP